MPPSFLQASAAKACATNPQAKLVAGLRMLLIEEEPGHFSHDDTISSLHPKLAFSLVMDAAHAVAASSNLACRGCTKANITHNNASPESCSCCKVAFLIPGETKQSRKRKPQSQSENTHFSTSRVIGNAEKIEFPMNCSCQNNSPDTLNHIHSDWNGNFLNQIHIKYVNSLSDLIKYLAYAPSLPDHLQPLDGIFILGLGDLLSRGNDASGLTEMTHVSDTGDALEASRREISKTSDPNNEQVTLIATLSQYNYESLPKRMTHNLHQWVDYVASIKSLNTDTSSGDENDSSMWELAVKTCHVLDAVDRREKSTSTSSLFNIMQCYDAHHEPCQTIVWNA